MAVKCILLKQTILRRNSDPLKNLAPGMYTG